MIVEFSVGNFKSFKDIETLHFQAAKIESKYEFVDANNTFPVSDELSLLKSKVVYGANASGKSNLMKAFSRMLYIIQYSFKEPKIIEHWIEPFLQSTETINAPTFFQIIFIYKKTLYRYGMQLKDGKVTDEWLFGTPDKEEVYYFLREGMEVKVNEDRFKEALKISDIDEEESPLYSETSLFLSVAAAFNRQLAKGIFHCLSGQIGIFSGVLLNERSNLLYDRLDDSGFTKKLTDFISFADMGIKKIKKIETTINNMPSKFREETWDLTKSEKVAFIQVSKDIYDENGTPIKQKANFMLHKHEAEGTKKLMTLSPLIFTALEEGWMLIIDEFDAGMHPRLTRKILELFNSKETNPKNAQLLAISHDTNLMDAKLLRRDQITFIDKDEFEASRIYSLVQFKGIRNNSSFENDYLKGRYKAVPLLNEMDNLFINTSELENA